MAYQTGVSTSPSNLLSLMETRLNTDGWTIVRNNGAAETGSSNQLSVSDPAPAEGNQYNFVAYDSPAEDARWEFQPSTGDSGAGAAFYNHTGTPNGTNAAGTHCMFGNSPLSTNDQGFSGSSISYHFFSGQTPSGNRYCHIVLEGTAGVYFMAMFGTIEKAGTFTGGQYATGTPYRNTSSGIIWPFQFAPSLSDGTQWIRADNLFSSGSPGWRELNGFFSKLGGGGVLNHLYMGGLTASAQRTPFAPMLVPFWANDTPSLASTQSALIGHVPDVMICSMDGREPGEVITLGSDNWHIFPVHRKTVDGTSTTSQAYVNTNVAGSAPNNDSNLQGIAFREP